MALNALKGTLPPILTLLTSSLFLSGCGALSFQPALSGAVEYNSSSRAPLFIRFQDSLSDFSEPERSLRFFEGAWNDPYLTSQWYLQNNGQAVPVLGQGVAGADIRLPEKNSFPSGISPVILALIDTGVDRSHPDLNQEMFYVNQGETGTDFFGRDKAVNGIDDDSNGYPDDVSGWSFADDSNLQQDSLGHGTHLAGILAAEADNRQGIASPWNGFRILSVQIFSGSRPSAPAEKIAEAIRYSVDSGARVISASFGTSQYSQALYDAVAYARSKDVLFVSAVGNFRRNLSREPSYPASFNLENQIAVAASDPYDLASDFTNFGPDVDVFAPGAQIFSTLPRAQYSFRSGTSQACPLVSAVAAQLRAQWPAHSSAKIKAMILESADERLGLTGFSPTARRLNTKNALEGRRGERLTSADGKSKRRSNFVLESEHPYRSAIVRTIPIRLDADAGSFRLHFERFVTHSADTLTIRDLNGRPLQRFSGDLGEMWSAVIRGTAADLEFRSDAYVTDWGWKIDQIELIAP